MYIVGKIHKENAAPLLIDDSVTDKYFPSYCHSQLVHVWAEGN